MNNERTIGSQHARRDRVLRHRSGRARDARVRAARRAAADGGRGRQRDRRRRNAAGRSGHRHRQDARLSHPRDSEPTARARLDRHEEPAGTGLLQGPAVAARLARRAIHRHADEGAIELPLPPSLGELSRRGRGQYRDERPTDRRRRPRLAAGHPAVGERRRGQAIVPSCANCRRIFRSGRRSPPTPTPASAPSVRATATAS